MNKLNSSLNVVELSENPSGHESHTYLWHIVSNWDNLSEWTTFCQGWPFDHCKDFLDKWDMQPTLGFDFLAHWVLLNDGKGRPNHNWDIPVRECYEAIFNNLFQGVILPPPRYFIFGAGCQFVVHRDIVRSVSVEYYKNIIEIGKQEPFLKDYGYVLERLWLYILGIDPMEFLCHAGEIK